MHIRIRTLLVIILTNLLIIAFAATAGVVLFIDDISRLIAVLFAGLSVSVLAAFLISVFFKKPLEKVEAMKEAAEASSRSKSNFIANISHEIRTPMNVILGVADILSRDEYLDPYVSDGIDTIYNSGEMLLGIINDMLDLSKIEAGKLELVLAKYGLASLINDTVVLNMTRSTGKPVEFKLYVDENLPAYFIGDELRIRQILNNLLTNAVKYTQQGEVTLSFHLVDSPDDLVKLVIIVSDTGRGMTVDQIGLIFDEYLRFNFDIANSIEGTGLGMGITRNLLNLMNGDVSVESELGKGTIFTVQIPQERIGTETIGKELAEELQNFHKESALLSKKTEVVYEPMPYGRVLIVDDVETNIAVAKGLMAPYSLNISTALSGYEAVDLVKDGNEYDIIFMDHMMPGMDGMEAVSIIREMDYTAPIIALTANVVVGQKDILLSNGFDDFVSKPINLRFLHDVLVRYVRDKQTPDVIESAIRQTSTKKKEPEASGKPVAVSPHIAEFFVRDALKAEALLRKLVDKNGDYTGEEFSDYTTCVHAMKTALATVGEPKLSSFARNLEKAGKDRSVILMTIKTPAFLDELRTVIEKFSVPEISDEHDDTADIDYTLLREELLAIILACEEYDKKTAKYSIFELRQKVWTPEIKDLLGSMSECLLSGDFEEVAHLAKKIIKLPA